MLCTRCKMIRPTNCQAGKCSTRTCTNSTSHKTDIFCKDCASALGNCQGCGQMVFGSGAGKPGTVKPLGQ